MKFEKIHGAKERQDGVFKIGSNKWEVIFGYGEDELGGYNLRLQMRHKPTKEELQELLYSTVNDSVSEKILRGLEFRGKLVWLSKENEMNYKFAHDRAIQTEGKSLPLVVKVGDEYSPEYTELKTVDEVQEFWDAVMEHIQKCIKEGWEEKDTIEWEKFV